MSAASTTSIIVSFVAATSCATQPSFAPLFILMESSPLGSDTSSRINLNNVDLPVPLRPIKPTFQPAAICAEALVNKARP